MKKPVKYLAMLLILLLFLAGCSKAKTGMYLGQDLFLEEDRVIKIHAPEGTILKLGKTYKYSYNEVMTSLPPQATVNKVINAKARQPYITKDLAKEIFEYTDARLVKFGDNLTNLPRDTIIVVNEHTRGAEVLRENGFKIVLEIKEE